jgi:hypothetical protein
VDEAVLLAWLITPSDGTSAALAENVIVSASIAAKLFVALFLIFKLIFNFFSYIYFLKLT